MSVSTLLTTIPLTFHIHSGMPAERQEAVSAPALPEAQKRSRFPFWSQLFRFIKRVRDRRASPRREVRGTVMVRTIAGQSLGGTLHDISETGTGAVIYGILEVGQRVTLTLEYESQHHSTQAVVRRRFGYKHGFEFT